MLMTKQWTLQEIIYVYPVKYHNSKISSCGGDIMPIMIILPTWNIHTCLRSHEWSVSVDQWRSVNHMIPDRCTSTNCNQTLFGKRNVKSPEVGIVVMHTHQCGAISLVSNKYIGQSLGQWKNLLHMWRLFSLADTLLSHIDTTSPS